MEIRTNPDKEMNENADKPGQMSGFVRSNALAQAGPPRV